MTDPTAGDVWRYAYLWAWQDQNGETEGRKDRPTAIVAVVVDSGGKTRLYLLPLTTQPPAPSRLFLQVPALESHRAGLTDATPVWVMLDEYNSDVLEFSVVFEPDQRIGKFSRAFMKTLLRAFSAAIAAKRATRVRRDT